MKVSLEHPGNILKDHFMKHHGITQDGLAKALGVDRQRINAIIGGRRLITADTALRLAKFFGTTAEYWLMLQVKWDIYRSQEDASLMSACDSISPLVSAATQPKIHLKKMANVLL